MATDNLEPDSKTILQKLLSLAFVGEKFGTIVALIPTFALWAIHELIYPNVALGIVFWILSGISSWVWLLYIEDAGKVILTTPIIPIPLKWLIPLLTLIMCVRS